ncbi:MAG: hypothetical protein R3C20_17870 [Planctomycetaceae bacterium]
MLIKPVLQEQVTQVVISLIFAAVLSMLMTRLSVRSSGRQQQQHPASPAH